VQEGKNMTKDVEVIVTAIQKYADHQDDDLKTVADGEYYFRNGSHYILYSEKNEGFTETTKNMLKLKDGLLEMTRKGLINTSMVFDKNKETESLYRTPFGELRLGIQTKSFYVLESEDKIQVEISYILAADGAPMADSKIRINVRSK
jgi:uncharacterized beta-barrel protein YwiB (DUF1934 family)